MFRSFAGSLCARVVAPRDRSAARGTAAAARRLRGQLGGARGAAAGRFGFDAGDARFGEGAAARRARAWRAGVARVVGAALGCGGAASVWQAARRAMELRQRRRRGGVGTARSSERWNTFNCTGT